MINYYFDTNGVYTHNLPANPNTLTPDNAIRVTPGFKKGFHPILNSTKKNWILTEDHRQKKNDRDQIIKGTGTPYWLLGDNYNSETKYMTALGKLPPNILLERPVKNFEELKAEKLEEIKQNVIQEEKSGYLKSSLGFNIDATRKSKEDVDGIIKSMENANVNNILFRDYDNIFHTLELEQVKTLSVEIINKCLSLYSHKWDLQELVADAKTLAELENIVW